MSRYGLLGRLSRILRGAVAGQVPHDMGAQVVDRTGADVPEDLDVDDPHDPHDPHDSEDLDVDGLHDPGGRRPDLPRVGAVS